MQARIQEARADTVNLMQPRWAYFRPKDVLRHRRLFVDVLGGLSGAALPLKVLPLALLLGVVPMALLLFQPETHWLMDLLFGAVVIGAIFWERFIFGAYREAFLKVYVVERNDFTAPADATGFDVVWLPRLAFLDRPGVWRGNDGQNGFRDHDSYRCLTLPEGRYVQDLLAAGDYYELPRDEYRLIDTSARVRRTWCRELQENGFAAADLDHPEPSKVGEMWPWLATLGMLVTGFLLVVMTSSGNGG